MSHDHFHVHGPHDHEVEHQAQHGDRFTSRIAVLTAILSTIGALFAYEAGHTGNEALIHKNDAAINKTHASDQWNFYQAKSNKQNLAELATVIAPAKQDFYQKEVERYKKEKEEIKKDAEKFEEKSKGDNELAELSSHVHERWALAMTLMQVAISLAAITLLTRSRWLLWGVYGAAGAGVLVAGLAMTHS
jgi:hypothetical protein